VRERLRRLWEHRRFVGALVAAELKVRFRGSPLGFLWTLATPAVILVVFTLVFTRILAGVPVPKFPVFMMSGYLPWHFTLAALINATYSLTAHARFMNLVALPRECFPLAECLVQFANLALALPVLLVAMAAFRVAPTPHLLWLLPLLLAQFVLTLGLAVGLSFLYLYRRDVKHALEAALTVLFYATPIFYPLAVVPDAWRPLYAANPFAALAVGCQDAVLFGRCPSAWSLAYPPILGFAILALSWRAFIALEADFAERI
jgi:ABC-type polysaccharide/polyol phosphate export permease